MAKIDSRSFLCFTILHYYRANAWRFAIDTVVQSLITITLNIRFYISFQKNHFIFCTKKNRDNFYNQAIIPFEYSTYNVTGNNINQLSMLREVTIVFLRNRKQKIFATHS